MTPSKWSASAWRGVVVMICRPRAPAVARAPPPVRHAARRAPAPGRRSPADKRGVRGGSPATPGPDRPAVGPPPPPPPPPTPQFLLTTTPPLPRPVRPRDRPIGVAQRRRPAVADHQE